MDNLWPSLNIVPQRTPLSILKEQAAMLGQQTQNLVTAEVMELRPMEWKNGETLPQKTFTTPVTSRFNYAFYLVAPALQFYRYLLFSISHPIELYPVQFRLDTDIYAEFASKDIFGAEQEGSIGEPTVIAKTEDQFIAILKELLNSSKTIRVIEAIYSQSYSTSHLVPVDS
jgi:hypothetical protein